MKLIIDIPNYKLDEVQNGSIASNEILKAVRKGTPISTKGDLISRSELKKAIGELFDNGGYDSGLVMNTIDNAPTVEVETCINYKLCKVRKQCELQKAIEDCED